VARLGPVRATGVDRGHNSSDVSHALLSPVGEQTQGSGAQDRVRSLRFLAGRGHLRVI